ncbi:hypothetical protein AVEN_67345-1 [Araneus ventricosus]|uniref:Uncharacterized protein n=1 Tax=Araneus ventricosus TaxID=182803 RepID=A0A4Y2GXZ4_ARAVE|nr:hypothetical protein AVEN_67345-1 [Araneus ventricosus]
MRYVTRSKKLEKEEGHFQQYRASPYCYRDVRACLEGIPVNSWLGRGCSTELSPHSPDLTLLDFLLGGYIKHIVCRSRPALIKEKRMFPEIN